MATNGTVYLYLFTTSKTYGYPDMVAFDNQDAAEEYLRHEVDLDYARLNVGEAGQTALDTAQKIDALEYRFEHYHSIERLPLRSTVAEAVSAR